MANGIHDVFLPNPQPWQQQPTVDPRLLKTQARGIAAANQLADIHQGPAMARALRMQNAEAPGVVGQGYAAQGPTLLQGLAHMAATRQGANQVRDLERQARALRGETDQGIQAQLEAEAQQAQINSQQQMDLARLASNERIALEKTRQGQMKGAVKPWINEQTGAMVNASHSPGKGMVDERGNEVSVEGMVPFDESRQAKQFGYGFKNLPATAKKDVIGADFGMRQLNDISNIANSLSPDQLKELQRPGLDVAVRAATPGAFEEYIQQNHKGLSREVKQYLQKVNNFASNIRHERFGSALTIGETRLAEAFLPSATGIGLMERADRLNSFYDDFMNQVSAVDNVTGSNFMERMPQRVDFAVPEDVLEAMKKENAYSISPEMEKGWQDLQAKNARYRELTGKDLPAYLEMQQVMQPKPDVSHVTQRQRNRQRGRE